MRLYNLRFTDWSQGTHHNTHTDEDGYLTLNTDHSSGYWEIAVDAATFCYSSIKTVSRLHPKVVHYYPYLPSTAGDTVNDAVDALRRGDITIVNCPTTPALETDDVLICRYLVEQNHTIFLRITPGYFTNPVAEIEGFLDDIAKNINPYGIFLDGFTTSGGIDSVELDFICRRVLERMFFRMYAPADVPEFVDYSSVATANDYYFINGFFEDNDPSSWLLHTNDVKTSLPCELVGYSTSSIDFKKTWTIATILGFSYWGNPDIYNLNDLPKIYCGYEWIGDPVVDGGIPSRQSDSGLLTWDYRGYPVYQDNSIQANVVRFYAREEDNYYGSSVSMALAKQANSMAYEDWVKEWQEVKSVTYDEEHIPTVTISSEELIPALPFYPTSVEYEDIGRYFKVKVALSTDDALRPPRVEYADVQLKLHPGTIAQFFTATSRMVDNFPRWMDMRELDSDREELPQSLGGKFLNFAAGENLAHGRDKYLWDQMQKSPSDLDLSQKAWCWRVPAGFGDLYSFTAKLDGVEITPFFVCSTEEFLAAQDWEDMCLFTNQGQVYTNRYYDMVWVNGEEYNLLDMHIWNSFDSWGMMLDLPRLRQEDNAHYRARMYDVFPALATANIDGIKQGLMRELSLAVPLDAWSSTPGLWGSTPEEWGATPMGSTPYFGCTPEIIELFQLGPGDTEWFDYRGFPTAAMKAWAKAINDRVGVTWDTIRDTKATWDMAGPNGEVMGFFPHRYDVTPWGGVPESATPWWEINSTPYVTFDDLFWGKGIGDFNDLLVDRPIPPTEPEEFKVSVYLDGKETTAYVNYPSVEIAWSARGEAQIDTFDPLPQRWNLTLWATTDDPPNADPSMWGAIYYAHLTGVTMYVPNIQYFNGHPGAGNLPANKNIKQYVILDHSAYSPVLDWQPSAPTIQDVTAYAIFNGTWNGAAWDVGSDNASVDLWWSTTPTAKITDYTNPVMVDLSAATPDPLGDMCIASNDIGSFINNAPWYTDYQATPPSIPAPFGPYKEYGTVIVNGVPIGTDPAIPGYNEVDIPAPFFHFHPLSHTFEWAIDITSYDPVSGLPAGFTVDINGDPTYDINSTVTQDGTAPTYDALVSTATFSSPYTIARYTSTKWTGGPIEIDGELLAEYNPHFWSSPVEWTLGSFGGTTLHTPHKFRLSCDNDLVVPWLDNYDASGLNDATPYNAFVRAKLKDYAGLEWNPRIHSGFFYDPLQEWYLYADRVRKTWPTDLDIVYDPADRSLTLPGVPAAGAPIIVIDNAGNIWRKISSWEYEGDIPTLSNVIIETMYGSGCDTIYTAYRGIEDVQVTDVTTNTTYYEGVHFSVDTYEENKIVFYDTITQTDHSYQISYVPEYSFYVDMQNVDDTSKTQKARIILCKTLAEMGISSISVYYEGSEQNPYFTEDTIRLNPLLTYWQKSFIFMHLGNQEFTSARMEANPTLVNGDGEDWCNVHITTMDADGNPIPNCNVTITDISAIPGIFPSTGLSIAAATSNEEGFTSITWKSPTISSDQVNTIRLSYIPTGGVVTTFDQEILVKATLDPNYHIDASCREGTTLEATPTARQHVEITLLNEDYEPMNGQEIARRYWTSLDNSPLTYVVGNTLEGKIIDSTPASDTPRVVFSEYYLSATPLTATPTAIYDSVCWTEYEIFNYPEELGATP